MRSCGLGFNALEKFCGLMNLPPPVSKKNYQNLSHKFRDTAKTVAEASMSAAIRGSKEGRCNRYWCFSRRYVAEEGLFMPKWSCCCSFHLKFQGGRCGGDVKILSRLCVQGGTSKNK